MQSSLAKFAWRRSRASLCAGWLLCLFGLAAAAATALAAAAATALAANSQLMPLAAKALLLDGQVIDGRIVVVGERGHILTSDDHGVSWQQQLAPTRATLTSVFFSDPGNGWAAGHDGVILQTRDGGRRWQQVYAAVDDERPILDLCFTTPSHGYAVGAYGLFLETRDGGANWAVIEFNPATLADEELLDDELDDALAEEPWGIDVHLNQMVATAAGRVFIAAEAGNLYRSDDGGRSWLSLPSPYEGSFYGTLPHANGELLAFGLRGHVFATTDAGHSWTPLETGVQATLNDGIRLRDGRLVLAGLAGTLLISTDQGKSFALHAQDDRAGIAKVLQAGDGALILLGEQGVKRLALPGAGEEERP